MDQIEKIDNSIIQHGPFNNRIYLMKYGGNENLPAFLEELALKNGYSKIIAKVPVSAQVIFLMNAYTQEAYIPGFFNGGEDVVFMAKYLDATRQSIDKEALSFFKKVFSGTPQKNGELFPKPLNISVAENIHLEEMAYLYNQVFKSYPFPITDVEYLKKTMDEGSVIYFGVWNEKKLVALSSAELDIQNKNAEMTDFAVLPDCRGQKLALFLLERMEKEMEQMGMKTLYTIARLNSPGMNRTFINQGYHFSGILKNNTNISGQIESMNVYYKNIGK